MRAPTGSEPARPATRVHLHDGTADEIHSYDLGEPLPPDCRDRKAKVAAGLTADRPPFAGASTGAVLVAVATEEPAPAPNAAPL